MTDRMPSLRALRAFEASARLLSFAKAAAELHVTAAAISQQVRALESMIGLTLFSRSGRSVRLTEAGERWLPEIRECLDNLYRAVEHAREHAVGTLSITVAPSFASRWLMRRLYRFNDGNPDVTVRVIATPELIDLRSTDVDMAIRFGSGRYPGLEVEKILPEYLIPMCSPSLLKAGGTFSGPDDLQGFTLIHDDSIPVEGGAWRQWLGAAGPNAVDAKLGARFSLADLALQAAIDGQGIVLARWQLARSDVEAGRLVCPFETFVEAPYSYYLVTRPELRKTAKVASFWDWVLDEAAAAAGKPVTPPRSGDAES